MVTLAIDTSETRGSVAVLRGEEVLARRTHGDKSEYSAWLLPAVAESLQESGIKLENVELLAVSTGPGSFTGLRVGLTTVKAWAEVYKTPVVGVSRLRAMARLVKDRPSLVAPCYDAQRGQLFGAAYELLADGSDPKRIVEEVVIAPDGFVDLVNSQAGARSVTWVSLDPQMIEKQENLRRRMLQNDHIVQCPLELAPSVGMVAQKLARRGEFSDTMALDANYVRRSDAEIFWKGTSAGVH
jgi:tRNA threonylcarbamoyladenosine biosynthesis protein TsaB